MTVPTNINPSHVEIFFDAGTLLVSWPPEDVPEDYDVQVIVTDDQGAALSPLPTISYNQDSATIYGDAIVAGAMIKTSLRLIAPPSEPTSITLLALEQPVAVTFDLTIEGLNVDWVSVDNAHEYDIEVQNTSETADAPFTFTSSDPTNTVRVAFEDLSERATYQARVRAVAEHSRSAWSDYASILVDKSLPVNPLLRALYDRLQAAGTRFTLNDDILQASNITNAFVSLLNQPEQTLTLSDKQLSATIDSVTLTGKLSIYEKSNVQGTFVFTVPSAMLELALDIALGGMTIGQLKSAELAPADIYSLNEATSWVDTLAVIENTVLSYRSATNSVVVTSSDHGPTWSLLGLQNVDLGAVKPQILSTRATNTSHKYFDARLITKLKLGTTHELDAYLRLPTDYLPWQLGLTQPFFIGSLSDIYALFGGNKLSVPTQFEALGQLTLDQLTLEHAPQSGIWKWYIAATLTPIPEQAETVVPSWKIIPSVLELESLGLALKANVFQSGDSYFTETAGIISGRFKLGSLDPIDAKLALPDDNGNWTLTAATNAHKPFALSDTAQLLSHNDSALNNALAKIGPTSGFKLEELRLSVNPDTPQITALTIAFQIQDWSVTGIPWFTMNEINARLAIVNPADEEQRQISGSLSSVMTIGTAQVGVRTSFDQKAIWDIRLQGQSAQLAGLNDLSNFVSSNNVASALPTGLPLEGQMGLAAFTMRYDSQNNYIQEATFNLEAQLGWDVVPDLFYIDTVRIALQVNQSSHESEKVVTGDLSALLNIGSAQFSVSGSKPTADDKWTLKGSLAQSVSIDFTSLLKTLISTDVQLPKGRGFPESLTIVGADVTLVPETGKFDFSGDALTEWSFDFGSTNFAIVALGGSIHRAGSDGGESSGELHGTFTIGDNIWGSASLALGSGNIDTVVSVTAGNGIELNPASLASSITGIDNVLGSIAKPADFNPPAQFKAGIELNVTQDRFFAWGELVVDAGETSPLYGLVALQVSKDATPTASEDDGNNDANPPTWNLVLAAAVKNFSFSRLSQSLSAVDNVISVEFASVILANNPVEISFQQRLMDKLQLGSDVTLADQTALKEGLTLYGKLTFGTSLLTNISALLVDIEQSSIVLFAHIGAQPEDTIFKAKLGNFTVFNVIRFANLALQYQPHVDTTIATPTEGAGQAEQTTSVLRLLADASIDFNQAGNAATLDFTGEMTISEQKAVFKVDANLNQTLTDPLGMFGVKLNDLFLTIDHSYTEDSPSIISVGGNVTLGRQSAAQLNSAPQLALTGKIVWVNDLPVLVDIELTQPLNLLAFFTSMFTDQQYPDSYPDITFKEGRIYYHESADGSDLTYLNVDYKVGFNIHTVVALLGLDVTLDVQVVENQPLPGLTGQQTGVVATGSFGSPITLWFLTLSDQSFSKSPSLKLQMLQSQKAFGLDVGFSFFGEHFATGFIAVGKTPTTKDAKLIVRFVYAGDIELFKNVSIAFNYSKSEGFNLTELPFHMPIALDLASIANALQQIQGSQCAKIADIGFKQLVKTHFFIKPKMVDSTAVPNGAQDSSLTLKIQGFYAVSIIDTNNPFLLVEMPEMTLSLQMTDNMTLSKLPGWIAEQIVANSEKVLEQIIKQPAKLTAFLAAVGAQALAKNLISELICKPEAEETAEAAEEAAEAAEAAEEAAEALETAEAAGESAEVIAELAAVAEATATAAMGAAAAAGAGTSAATGVIAGIGAVVGAGIGGAVSGFFDAIFGGKGQNSDGASTGHHDHPGHQQRPKLTNPSAIIVSATSDIANIHWSKVDSATYYIVRLKPDSHLAVVTTSVNAAQFNVGGIPPGSYHVEIIAYSANFRPSDMVSSESFAKLSAPSGTRLSLSGQNTLIFNIGPSVQFANSYHAQLMRNNQPTGDIKEIKITPLEASFTLPDVVSTYRVRAYSSGNANTIPSAWQTSSDSIAPLAEGAASQISFTSPNLTATLTANTPNASEYLAQLLIDGAPHGEALPMQAAGEDGTVNTLFTISDDINGNTLQVQTRATGTNNLPSPWMPSINSITRVAEPSLQALTVHEDTITATLNAAVANATGYQAQLLLDNAVMGNPVMMTITAATADTPELIYTSFNSADIHTGKTFSVRVRAIAEQHPPSNWITSTDNINRLDKPTLQPLSLSNDILTVTLAEATVNANSYQAQLIADGVPVGDVIPLVTSTEPTPVTHAQINIDDSIAGTEFQIQVQAIGTGYLPSIWASSTDKINRLDKPTLQPLSLSDDTVTVTLTEPTANANSYQAQLIADGVPVGDIIPLITSTDPTPVTQAQINIDDSIAGTEFQVQVQAIGTGYLPSIWASSTDKINRLDKPTLQPLSLSDDTVTVTLTEPTANADSYQAQLIADGVPVGDVIPLITSTDPTPVTQAQINIDDSIAGTEFQVQVQAIGTGYLPSIWASSTDKINRLDKPTLQPLSLSNDILTVTLAEATVNANSYQAQLIADGVPVGDVIPLITSTDPTPVTQAQINIDESNAGAEFQVQVQAIGTGYLPSIWASSTDKINRLDKPILQPLSLSDDTVTVTLTEPTANADSYQAQLIADGVPVGDVIPLITSTDPTPVTQAQINIDDSIAGAEFQVQVQAIGAGYVPSVWTSSTDKINRLDQPILQPLSLSDDTVTVTLTEPTANADSYQAQLIADGVPVGDMIPLVTSTEPTPVTQAQINIDDSIAGAEFQVQVQAIGAGYVPSVWTSSTDKINRLDQPILQPLSLSDDTVTVTLTEPTANADSYQAQLIADGVPVGDMIPLVTSTEPTPVTQAQINIDDSIAGTEFQIQVQAIGTGYLPSIWTSSTDKVNRLDKPTLQPLSLSDDTLTVTLTEATVNADSYQAQLIADGVPVGDVIPLVTSTDPTPVIQAHFSVDNSSAGAEFQIQVKAIGAGYIPSIWASSTDKIKPRNLQVHRTLFWNFENASSVGRISSSIALALDNLVTGIASQTGGGPFETFGEHGRVLITRNLGTHFPYIDLNLTTLSTLLNVSFQHFHNHNPRFPTNPSYEIQLQLDSGMGFSDIGKPFTVNNENYGTYITVELNGLTLQPGTHRIRWISRNLHNNAVDTGTEYFALNNVLLSVKSSQQVLSSNVKIEKDLYPVATANAEQEVLPYTVPIAFNENKIISQVVVLSDWWNKRPKKITVFDGARVDDVVIAQKLFPDYDEFICGENGTEKCEYPARPTSLFRVDIDRAEAVSNISVEIDELYDPANLYVILKAIHVYSIPEVLSATLFWDFSIASSDGQVSSSDGQSTSGFVTGVASQTGGGPIEKFDQIGDVLITHEFGEMYPFIEFTTIASTTLANLGFQYFYNDDGNSNNSPYTVQLQIDIGNGYVDIGEPLVVNVINMEGYASIALGETNISAGTYRIRWIPKTSQSQNEDASKISIAMKNVTLNLNV